MIEGQQGVTWDHWLRLAEAAERLGFEALFRSDHYFSVEGVGGRGSTDAWTLLAALAAETERIRLGTLVSPVTFRLPVRAREGPRRPSTRSPAVASRSAWAPGWWTEEHTQLRVSRSRRRASGSQMLEEQLADRAPAAHRGSVLVRRHALLARRTWSSSRSRCNGRVRRSIVGGKTVGPWMQRLIGAWADEFNTVGGSPDEVRERFGRARDGVAAAGREPDIARHVADDVDASSAPTEDEYLAKLERARSLDPTAGPFDAYRADIEADCIVGTPERAAETLLEVRGGRRAAHHAEPRAVRRPRDARTPCHTSVPEGRRMTFPSPAAPSDPDLTGDERTLLTQFLDYQRTVMLRKIGELDDDGLRQVMTPSGLTLLGMLKHLAFVERWWFRVVFSGEQGIDPPWTDADPDADWRVEPDETSEDIRALFDDEVARARAIVADGAVVRRRLGRPAGERSIAPLDHAPHDRGVRATPRPRRHHARGHRRADRRLGPRTRSPGATGPMLGLGLPMAEFSIDRFVDLYARACRRHVRLRGARAVRRRLAARDRLARGRDAVRAGAAGRGRAGGRRRRARRPRFDGPAVRGWSGPPVAPRAARSR